MKLLRLYVSNGELYHTKSAAIFSKNKAMPH